MPNDVLLFEARVVENDDADLYCVEEGARILELIADAIPSDRRGRVLKDDSWASVDLDKTRVSIVWVNEERDAFTWALQFAPAKHESVFAVVARMFPNARWVSENEFRRIF